MNLEPQAAQDLNESRAAAFDGWTLHEIPQAGSTNDVASRFPAWHAVRADRQTAGRGRFQRSWVSDQGGLWLSAAVPTGPDSSLWRALPLAAGLAVVQALRLLGVPGARMRWPNDILVEDRKLAGLLIDQFRAGLAVVGIGINVFNHPDGVDSALRGQVARLADLVPQTPSLGELARRILRQLRCEVEEMRAGGFVRILPRVNELWSGSRNVVLDFGNGRTETGRFEGVDAEGRIQLSGREGGERRFDFSEIILLREI